MDLAMVCPSVRTVSLPSARRPMLSWAKKRTPITGAESRPTVIRLPFCRHSAPPMQPCSEYRFHDAASAAMAIMTRKRKGITRRMGAILRVQPSAPRGDQLIELPGDVATMTVPVMRMCSLADTHLLDIGRDLVDGGIQYRVAHRILVLRIAVAAVPHSGRGD